MKAPEELLLPEWAGFKEAEHVLFPDLVRFALLLPTLSLWRSPTSWTHTTEFLPLEKIQESVKLQYSKKAFACYGRSLCPRELVMACFLVQPYSSFSAVTAHRLRKDRASSVTFPAAFSAVLTTVPDPWQMLNKYLLVMLLLRTRKLPQIIGN